MVKCSMLLRLLKFGINLVGTNGFWRGENGRVSRGQSRFEYVGGKVMKCLIPEIKLLFMSSDPSKSVASLATIKG